MIQNKISIRQWQEMYQAGIFHQDAFHIPEQAGWDDFYDPLNNKGLQNLSKLAMSITHPFVLDNYHVYFLHHTPGVGPMFGCAYFDLLSEDRKGGRNTPMKAEESIRYVQDADTAILFIHHRDDACGAGGCVLRFLLCHKSFSQSPIVNFCLRLTTTGI